MKTQLTHDRLLEVLHYAPGTGAFTWLCSQGRQRAGGSAGCNNSHGYRNIRIDGKIYNAHRLAWLYVHGAWPEGQIDHINGVCDDNRFANLRDVSRSCNQQNQRRPQKHNRVGFLGVCREKGRSKFRALIRVNGGRLRLGSFNTPEEAYAAYLTAKRQLHAGCTI